MRSWKGVVLAALATVAAWSLFTDSAAAHGGYRRAFRPYGRYTYVHPVRYGYRAAYYPPAVYVRPPAYYYRAPYPYYGRGYYPYSAARYYYRPGYYGYGGGVSIGFSF